ncbi:hypothetical protein [Paludisphaera sp.]|uniref:hypothetical protein n=1 Tax=Paludisphaera sp. TaxID=2017432 RepID=UPI00301E34AA
MLGRLVVPVVSDASGFKAGLASASAQAESFSRTFEKTHGGILARLGTASGMARGALEVGDLGRAAVTAAVGVGRLRLAFMEDGAAADKLRARLDKARAGLIAVRDASYKARLGLVGLDLGLFTARLARLGGEGALGAAKGLGRIVMAGVTLGASLFRAGESIKQIGEEAGRSAHFFGKFAAAASRRDWGKAVLYGAGSIQSLGRAATWLPGLAGGVLGVGRAGLLAGAGLLQFGGGLAKIGWQVGSRGLGMIVGGLSSVVSTAFSAATSLAKVGSLVAVVAGYLGVKAAASAAHLNETFNATKETFSDSADGVIAASKEMQVAFGTNQHAFLEGSNSLGALLQGMGYATEDSAKLGTNLAKLAADASAFRDVPLDVALGKIRAGMSGESEPLKQWGIIIDDSTVKAYAYANGLAKQGEEVSNAAKAQARMALITRGLAKDQGALAREATGPAAQMAEFWGRVQALTDTVGASLSPAFGSALEVINVGIAAVTDNWNWWSGVVTDFVGGAGSLLMSWGSSVLDFFELSGQGSNAWQIALGFVANAWQAVGMAFNVASSIILTGLSTVTGALGLLGKGLDWILEKTGVGASGIGDYFDRLSGRLMDQAEKQAEKFKAEMRQPWASMRGDVEKIDGAIKGVFDGVGDAYKSAADKIKAAREAASAPLNFTATQAVTSLESPEKARKEKRGDVQSGAFEFGSKEASSIAARTMFGGVNNEWTVRTAKAAEATVKAIERLGKRLPAANADPVVGLMA